MPRIMAMSLQKNSRAMCCLESQPKTRKKPASETFPRREASKAIAACDIGEDDTGRVGGVSHAISEQLEQKLSMA
jgi:hypothetical protein